MPTSTPKRIPLFASALALALLLLPHGARALPVVFDIGSGSEGSFEFSFIHSADSQAGMAPFYPSGTKLFAVSGELRGDLEAGTFTASPSTLLAQGLAGGIYTGDWSLEITGGALSQSGSHVGGSLDFVLREPDADVFTSGAFLFEPLDFGGPNVLGQDSLRLWGNNWDVGEASRAAWVEAGNPALGLDLGGPGAPIPEPSAYLAFAMGAVLTGAAVRRTRSRARA